MRVLSVQQPWAHLIMKGVKQIEIRSWTSTFKGRIAIHASANAKWQETEAEWKSSSAVARCFAEQGRIDRDDLKALPRSAILGTVELLGVHRGAAVKAKKHDIFNSDPVADVLESAVRDRVTGHLRAARTRVRTLPLTIPDSGYVWAFGRPHEVDPIFDVPGQQHLWELPADVAAQLAERDTASRRGEWTAPAVSSERRKASLAACRTMWETDLEREAFGLLGEVIREVEVELLEFDDPQTEKWFKRTFKAYMAAHLDKGAGGAGQVRIEKRLQSLFNGHALVPAVEFERELRRLVHKLVNEEKIYAEELARFKKGVALLTELRAQAEDRPVALAAIRKEVKAAYKRMFLESAKELERADRWMVFDAVD